MNYLPAFISPELAQALGWTILHSLWQGALVAVILSVLMIILHRHSAKVRYSVATAALFTVLAMAMLTFGRTYQEKTQQPNATVYHPINQTSPAAVTPAPAKAAAAPAVTEVTEKNKPMWRGAILVNFKYYFSKHLPVVVLVWLLGMLTMLLRFLGGLAYVQRLKHTHIYPLGSNWNTRLQDMTQRLRVSRPVQLAESALVKTPLVIGYLKPVILLPFGTVAGLSPEQVEAILAHELAHIYRQDYLLNIGQALVEILFFFNPAVWWISDYVRIERENCCDDQAIALCGNPLTYARALANLQIIPVKTPRLTMAFAGKDGSLLSRIKRLVQPHCPPTFSEGFLAACVLIVGLTVISVSAAAGFRLTGQEEAVSQVKYTPAMIKNEIKAAFAPEETDYRQAGNYTITDSTGKKSDLIIIKNKKGDITELYVNGRKIPQQNIPEFRALINQSLASAEKAPRLKATDKAAALAEMKQSLKKLEKQQFTFPFDLNHAKLSEVQQELLKKFKDQPEVQQQMLKHFDKFDNQYEVQRELLKKLEDQQLNFTFDSSFFRSDLRSIPPVPPLSDLASTPVMPALPPLSSLPPVPFVSLLPPLSRPLEYLRSKEVTEKTLLVIDGKKTRKTKGQDPLAGLTNDNIRGINILKGKKATQKYGNEGKDGVVEITTGPGTGYFFNLDSDAQEEALRKHKEAIRQYQNDLRQQTLRASEHNLRAQEQKNRLQELETQTKVRLQEHEARLKEHAVRLKEHEARMREHEKRAKEHEVRAARLEAIKKELVNDKLIDVNSKNLSININQDGFILNGVKQPAAVFDKYKKLFFPDRKDWSGPFNESINISHSINITED